MHFIREKQDRLLGAALGLSIALHAALLAMQFGFPVGRRWKQDNVPLEVVLVNAKTRERPGKAETLAQSNLDRGGSVLARARPDSPGHDRLRARGDNEAAADRAVAAVVAANHPSRCVHRRRTRRAVAHPAVDLGCRGP